MKELIHPHIPDHLAVVLRDEFGDEPMAFDLFDELFERKVYERTFATRLCEMARGGSGASWEIRRLATLVLEHLILKLPAGNVGEFEFLFSMLGIGSCGPNSSKRRERLLTEGYSTTATRGFIVEFRRKLRRLNRVHRFIKGRRTGAEQLRDFIHLSRRDCKLTIARYLWDPREVVDRILNQSRLSKGMPDTVPADHPYVEQEAARALARLPEYEREIIKRLGGGSSIYWVGEQTGSEINSLLEYPLGTVVLVVKPPGSDAEIEVKRAGNKTAHPLNIVYQRDGYMAPPSHRLHGGSIGHLLRWEAGASSILSKIYRLVHRKEAPIPITVFRSSIHAVPLADGEQRIVSYFSDPEVFGEGFQEMRTAMRQSSKAFFEERDWGAPPSPGELGLTVHFLSQVAPGQAILSGTSSFRLDLVARCLSTDGADRYFAKGLKLEYSRSDARRLADEVLEETLGVYTPPGVEYLSHEQYVEAAFAVPPNRARADRLYLFHMRQIGTFWGTLFGVRGFSKGESFVARNVGLKSVWEQGEWKVKLIFMDHDELNITGKTAESFHPMFAIPGMIMDERHVFGGKSQQGEAGFLAEIYRIPKSLDDTGRSLLRESMRTAFKKTVDAMSSNPELQALFYKSFIGQVRDWDMLVVRFLEAKRDAGFTEAWRTELITFLSERGYEDRSIKEYVRAFEVYSNFIHRFSFLY